MRWNRSLIRTVQAGDEQLRPGRFVSAAFSVRAIRAA
jgi:hypothetical protein